MRMTRTFMFFLFFLALLSLSPQVLLAQSPQETLNQYISDLQKNPNDNALREKIIRHAQTMSPAPAVPEEAERYMARGTAAVKNAKDANDFRDAVNEFEKATLAAPWLASAYYNLGIARDKAGQYADAIKSLKLYLLAAPNAPDIKAVKNLVYEIEYKQEKAVQEALKPKPPRPQDLVGTWYWKGYGEGFAAQVSAEGDWLLFSMFENASKMSGKPYIKFRLNGFELEESSIEKSGLTNVSGEESTYECLERLKAQGGFRGRMVPIRGKVSADGKTIIFQYRDRAHKQGCQLGYHDFEVIYTR